MLCRILPVSPVVNSKPDWYYIMFEKEISILISWCIRLCLRESLRPCASWNNFWPKLFPLIKRCLKLEVYPFMLSLSYV